MMRNLDPDKFRREDDSFRAAIPVMPRVEYLKKYPNGAPDHFSGSARGDDFVQWYSAIKRRRKEASRPSWIMFWIVSAVITVVLVGAAILSVFPQTLFVVLVLILCYCFIQMGMNLPYR